MSDINHVKLQSLVESQIPEFLNEESPLFSDFLQQYYISQEHETGAIDLAINLSDYKRIDKFNDETFYSKNNPCRLTSEIFYFSDTINVNSTKGFPKKYGLLKINDEIITYTGITTNSFTGCIRGFSGIDKEEGTEVLKFTSTSALNHDINSSVKNLSLNFFEILFKKFKSQFLPGFEDRTFSEKIQLKNILFKARDFYTSKGTDTAFKILFDILYSTNVQVLKPQEYLLSPSSSEYFVTKNILLEQVIRDNNSKNIDFKTLERLKGKTLFQNLSDLVISAAIFNAEYRPFDNINLYEISLDSDSYVLDFSSTKKTKLIEDVSPSSTTLTVDSTVGFEKSGTLLIKTDNLQYPLRITYQDKTINQFLGVSGLLDSARYGSNIIEDNLLYVIDDDGSKIEFRLINIIESIETQNTSNLVVGDKISLSSFGENVNDKLQFNTWIYNLPILHEIRSITLSGAYLNIRLYNQDVKFLSEDKILLINSKDTSQTQIASVVSTIEDPQGVFIQINFVSDYQRYDSLRKLITKGNSKNNYFPNVSSIISGVQNTYIDYKKENLYVASNGLPNYVFDATDNRRYVSTSIEGSDTLSIPGHNFLTGEKIYYISSFSQVEQSERIVSGAYYVYKVDSDNIRISLSQNDLIIGKYIISNKIIPQTSDYVVKFGYEDLNGIKPIKNQKLLKKINLKKITTSSTSKTINDRTIGMLLNGVEINSPTLYDENVYYGEVSSILIDNPGKDYDVINFSGLNVSDIKGSGCKLHSKVVGSVKEVKLISPGVGYQSKPKITISGGNGKGAVLDPNLVKTNIVSTFKGDLSALDFNEDSITFLDKHNFNNGEELIYNSNSNLEVSPFKNNSRYFAKVLTDKKVTLHNTENDSVIGINTINLAGISTGVHSFTTANLKNTITKIYVKNPGEGYSNAKIIVPSTQAVDNKTNGINIYDNYIFAKGHGFNTGDIVEYSHSQYSISGLSTNSQYCVYSIDENRFKLSEVGLGTDPITINLDRKKYVDFSGIGSGFHTFKYPPIVINIESISSIGSTTVITPSLKPVILGSIENIFIENPGSNYGESDIINFHRRPLVGVSSITSEAVLKPVIFNGSIISIQILNRGKGYGEDIDLLIVGKGKYAELEPVITNQRITDVKVLNGGVGYDEKTSIIIKRRGSGLKIIPSVKEWKINQVVKNSKLFTQSEEGFIIPSKDSELGLKYVNFFPPKKLRYLLSDNISANNEEISPTSSNKKPYVILGWAYDGNPIFGPYARFGSEVRKVNSSYRKLSKEEKDYLDENNLRPKGVDYPVGFFIQDFIFDKKRSSGDLDEYNGMFVDDPSVPGINYGYFMTIDDSLTSSIVFPYVIGNNFKDFSNYENFEPSFNQDSISSSLELIRNIGPYYIDSFGSSYEEIDKVDEKYNQIFIVKEIKSSGITSVSIYDSGDNYKVGDRLILDETNTNGNGASIDISRISGKPVSAFQVGISTFKQVSFVLTEGGVKGITSVPHNYKNNQQILVSSISEENKSSIEGFRKINVVQKSVGITSNIPPQSITGISTYIDVYDVFGFSVDNYIGLGTEVLKITKISESESRLYVNRGSGYATTHYAGISSVVLLPNSFVIKDGFYDVGYKENKTRYFNPSLEVGIGTSGSLYYKSIVVSRATATFDGSNRYFIGVGTENIQPGDAIYGQNVAAGTTVVSVGIGSIQINPQTPLSSGIATNVIRFERSEYDRFVPERSIYIENHEYYTGQELIYHSGIDGSGLTVTDTNTGVGPFQLADNQKVYAINLGKDFVGLSTLGFTTSSGIGTQLNSVLINTPNTSIGYAHSLRTTYPELKGRVESFYVDINTSLPHGLLTNDNIKIDVAPSLSNTVKIRYDANNRKITTDLIPIDSQLINTQSGEIPVLYDNLKTGDKIVYYNNNNASISGLTHNGIYYVLRENSDFIKLSDSYYDSQVGISKSLPSVGVGTHHIALVNPPLKISRGNILTIELDEETLFKSDNTLNFDFDLFYDSEYKNKIEKFKYQITNSTFEIDTSKYDFGSEVYYNLSIIDDEIGGSFSPLDSDTEVNGNNKIKIENSILNDYFSVVSTGTSSFRINLNRKPDSIVYSNINGLKSISYDSDSKNISGPISKFKINYSGLNYKRLPNISKIKTHLGRGAIVKPESNLIGKIEVLERIKDGFDYPTDYTLLPLLSVPTIARIKDISRVDYVGILTGGSGYKRPPSLKVIGNDKIKLSSILDGGSVVGVDIVENASDLSRPLEIIPIRNSNGIEIDFIEVNGTTVTLELINSDVIIYPYINVGAGSTIYDFPFKIGDKIFIENCRKAVSTQNTDSFNSKDYDYSFFTITSVDEDNFTITYDMSEVKSDFNGNLLNGEANYSTDFGYGYVVNKKNMPVFEMNLIDDLSYLSGERVFSDNFTGFVMDNGWDNDINQLRIIDSKGDLEKGQKLKGETSLLNGTIESINTYNLKASVGSSREKVNDTINKIGILNDYQQRLSDNNYYQKFSYSLKSEIPYTTWKEPVLSLAHPSGFKEFSDLDIISKPNSNLKVRVESSDLKLVVNIDNYASIYQKDNFAIVTENEDNYFEGSIERVTLGAEQASVSGIGLTGPIIGVSLRPYTLNKTNKVLQIEDIDSQFDGSNEFTPIGNKAIEIKTLEPYNIGISTANIQIGDYIGLSTYLQPNSRVVGISTNKVTLNKPHKLSFYYGNIATVQANTTVDNAGAYSYDDTIDSTVFGFDFTSFTFDSN